MKSLVIAFAVVASAFRLFASDGASVVCLGNGDVELENVGSSFAAPRTIVELSTNADCRVVCQVYYRNNLNPLPAEIDEIAATDRLVNVMLATYLGGECWSIRPDELVECYRDGKVFDLLLDFPDWMARALDAIYGEGSPERPDLTVVAVSMVAVGELAVGVAE